MANEQNKKDYIELSEPTEKAFLDKVKTGIYKELYQRELLTKEQLNHLLNIA